MMIAGRRIKERRDKRPATLLGKAVDVLIRGTLRDIRSTPLARPPKSFASDTSRHRLPET
jgi:hypothetical protein